MTWSVMGAGGHLVGGIEVMPAVEAVEEEVQESEWMGLLVWKWEVALETVAAEALEGMLVEMVAVVAVMGEASVGMEEGQEEAQERV